jgi:hypothetical protein
MGADSLTSFAQFGDAGQRLSIIYDNKIDDVDLWVGGLAESPEGESLFGSTFSSILKEQFERTRNGDRFWYENRFSGEDLHKLNKVTLSDIIKRNTDVENIQDDVFVASNNIALTPNMMRVAPPLAPVNEPPQAADGADDDLFVAADEGPFEAPVSLAEAVTLVTDTIEVSQAEADAIVDRAQASAAAEVALAESAAN